MSLLYKALSSSKSLVFTIIAGTLYHVVLGAAQFEVIWAVEDKGFNPNTFWANKWMDFCCFWCAWKSLWWNCKRLDS